MAVVGGAITGIGMAVAGIAVAAGTGVAIVESGKASAQAMLDCARIKADTDYKITCRQQDTEEFRIREEGRQANMWHSFDVCEAKADRAEALACQKDLDQSMGVCQDERNVQKSSQNNGSALAHQYPSPIASGSGGATHASA